MAEQPTLADTDDSQTKQAPPSFNPLLTLWRHKALVALGVVVGCVLGALFYSRTTPIYQSSAQVLVVNKTPASLPLPGSEGHVASQEDYLSTHQTLIRSPAIVAQAVRKGDLRKLKSFTGKGDPTGEISGTLKVSRETNAGLPTNILSISYRSSEPEDCAAVLNAVIESYQEFLSARYKSVTDDTAKLIAQANEILEKKLNKKQEEYDRFCLEHPVLMKGKDGLSSSQERLALLEGRRLALLLQEAEVQGRLEAFQNAVRDGRLSQVELMALVTQTTNNTGADPTANATAALEERLMTLQLLEKTLLDDYGPGYPQVASTRKQIALIQAQLERLGKSSLRDEAGALDPVKKHVQSLKMELENIRMALGALEKLVAEEQKKANLTRGYEKQDQSFRLEIARSQQLFDAISKRLDEVSLLKNFTGGYEAETISPARPGVKVYPSSTFIFTVATVLGFLVGFGLAYLAELSDLSFHTPEEIRRRLGLPVVGHIPYFGQNEEAAAASADDPNPMDPMLCAVLRPRSREAEAYRGVRTAVLFACRDKPHTVLQITSPDMGDGKSTLSANLGISLAQSEKKVLIVDADFRRPRTHKLFNVPGKTGLASVIGGDDNLADAIQPTAIPNLYVLPCGPIPPNPAELLTLPRFAAALAALREQFDVVLIDTPPLLAVTDPCVVVPHVDGVILTIRISKNARPHALRAREILTTLGARILGVVVNGVGRYARGYGYDNYRYGYTYRYTDYTSEGNAYYTEAAEEAKSSPEGKKGKAKRSSPRGGKSLLSWLLSR